jgi:hypothetical protein
LSPAADPPINRLPLPESEVAYETLPNYRDIPGFDLRRFVPDHPGPSG